MKKNASKNRINIILMGNFLYPEGMAATRRKQQFIDYFREQGADVKVLVLYQGSRKCRPIEECEGWHKGVYFRIIGNRMTKSLKILYQFPIFLFQACRLLIKWRVKNANNVILSFGFDGFVIIPFLWSKMIGYKIFFDIVEDFSLYPKNTFKSKIYFSVANIIDKLFLNSLINGVCVISSRLENKYRKNFNGAIIIVPISATVDQLVTKTRYNNPIKFMYAGSFSFKDGIEILLKGFVQINKRYPNTKLILSGYADKKRIQELFVNVNNPNIEFVGRLTDYQYFKLLNSVDILLMTRVNTGFANAGFPYKLGEYLATGNVVISTRVSDIEYYLHDKENAILIEPGNINDLIMAMEFCILNEKTCIEIGKNGQKICNKYFNPKINSRLLFDFLAVT